MEHFYWRDIDKRRDVWINVLLKCGKFKIFKEKKGLIYVGLVSIKFYFISFKIFVLIWKPTVYYFNDE